MDVEPPIHSTRYRVAVKRTRGPVQVDSRHLRPSTREEAPAPTAEASQDEDPEDAVPFQGRPAAKRIIVSAEESCLYFGELLDGMRTGRGRTEQESGATAYEGDYKNDQRDGWGRVLLPLRGALLYWRLEGKPPGRPGGHLPKRHPRPPRGQVEGRRPRENGHPL